MLDLASDFANDHHFAVYYLYIWYLEQEQLFPFPVLLIPDHPKRSPLYHRVSTFSCALYLRDFLNLSLFIY